MSYVKLKVVDPHEEIGFIEYNRAFNVWGEIISKDGIPNDAKLLVKLINETGEVVRYCHSEKKNQACFAYHPALTCYAEDLDKQRKGLVAYGFPELMVKDLNKPYESLRDATIKCWYSDKQFKALMISASDVKHGAIADDGLNLLDEKGEPYSTLAMGKYTIEVSLSFAGQVFVTTKDIVIEQRTNQLLCRFNPVNHKERMKQWSKENNYQILDDLMPGYLNPYLGKWYYHMGLLKMYRANDLTQYLNTHVRMFNYLIDETSTSYATEIAYIQTRGLIENRAYLSVYYYDIGEANIGSRKAKIKEFTEDYLALTRIDIVKPSTKENIYHLDRSQTLKSLFYDDDLVFHVDEKIAISGVIRPMQFAKEDFVLLADNTYQVKNEISSLCYTFIIDGQSEEVYKKNNMERIAEESIGKAIYEFYNLFTIKNEWKGKTIKVNLAVLDTNGQKTKAKLDFEIKVD